MTNLGKSTYGPVKYHNAVTEDERNVIVNALAFYHRFYTGQIDADEREFCRMAYKEDAARVDVDDLATRFAQLS
jgi:hypothetical protein